MAQSFLDAVQDYQAPAYTEEEIYTLRITRVHFLGDLLLLLLSDGKVLCLPVAISPKLTAASQENRYQWRLAGAGRAVVWWGLEEILNLDEALAHPDARVGDLP